jgi:hypothetical protein
MTNHKGYRGTHRGFKIATRSERRFVVVYYRDEERTEERTDYRGETRIAVLRRFAEIVKRTDSIATARRERERIGYARPDGIRAFIVDTTTGKEIV